MACTDSCRNEQVPDSNSVQLQQQRPASSYVNIEPQADGEQDAEHVIDEDYLVGDLSPLSAAQQGESSKAEERHKAGSAQVITTDATSEPVDARAPTWKKAKRPDTLTKIKRKFNRRLLPNGDLLLQEYKGAEWGE